jgi:hypothetical protein
MISGRLTAELDSINAARRGIRRRSGHCAHLPPVGSAQHADQAPISLQAEVAARGDGNLGEPRPTAALAATPPVLRLKTTS